MRSHSYLIQPGPLVRALAAPILGAGALTLLLHASAWFGLLPPARPIDNPDETVLVCKSQMSRSHLPAEVVLVGDSSCATGVDALQLGARLPGQPAVLNLGLVIGMGLDIYGEALSDFLSENPFQTRLVVLLVTPQLLTDESLTPVSQEYWHQLRRRERVSENSGYSLLSQWVGIPLLRERLLPRILGVPLKGGGGEFYGFSTDLARYLFTHHGTMVDPGVFLPPRHPGLSRYYLAPTLKVQTERFRRRVPPGVKIVLGLTPLPQSLSTSDYPSERDTLLRQWNQWCHADALLTNAPARFPDVYFATGAHLNQEGQRQYTRQLAPLLAPLCRDGALRTD